MSKIIDISPPLTDDIAVWPGDVPFSYQRSHDIREGANITLGDLRTQGGAGGDDMRRRTAIQPSAWPVSPDRRRNVPGSHQLRRRLERSC